MTAAKRRYAESVAEVREFTARVPPVRSDFLTSDELLIYLDEPLPLGRVTDNRQVFEPVKPFRTLWHDLVGWPDV